MLPAPPLASGTRASIGAGAPPRLLRTGCRSSLAAPAPKHERPDHESTRAHAAMRAARGRRAPRRGPDGGALATNSQSVSQAPPPSCQRSTWPSRNTGLFRVYCWCFHFHPSVFLCFSLCELIRSFVCVDFIIGIKLNYNKLYRKL